ncbi:lipocalin family protein [Rhizosphaericola mali]|uniref:Lipocalin n=1 Tax=Rhizosphaericola mali TaxID=2545455 RepID=A0A5P2FXR5_9BACT|nr:lipocalin family protein [Rhizosphaericola mali]QES88324.1 lipocalin [Rhizosphaericola mali]
MKNKKKYIALGTLALGTTIAIASAQVKSRNDVIEHLDVKKYMGKWYEIARVENKFEKGLYNVTAEYQLQKNGTIRVQDSGYSQKKNKREQAIGKTKFTSKESNGGLKVSFFGPFYSAYNIVQLDENYKYALIFGKNSKYLWILSREKNVPSNIKQKYLNYASDNGYDTTKLVWN